MKYQLQSAGANSAKLLEKFEKNSKYVRNLSVFTKIMISIYFAVMAIVPLITYFSIMDAIAEGGASSSAILLTGSFIFLIYFGLQMGYLLILGMPVVGELMSGDVFRFLETLPISKNKLNKLGFTTVFKNYDAPLITMFLVFPIIALIVTQNIFIFLVCLGVSFLNVVFALCLLVLLSERMARFMKKHEEGGAKATIIRILTMLSYVGVMFIIIFFVQSMVNMLPQIFDFFSNLEASSFLNYIFSLIPFPFSPGYVISLLMLPIEIPIFVWITSFIGFGLYLLLVRKVYKSALNSLTSLTSQKYRISEKSRTIDEMEEEIAFEVEPISPIKAYLRKDLITATRDLQTLMFLVLPFIIPIITMLSTLSGISAGGGGESAFESVLFFWAILASFSVMDAYMLITGLLNLEEAGSSMLASLPINPRDQAIAKLIIIIIIVPLALIFPLVFLITQKVVIDIFIMSIASIPLALAIILLVFELKIYLFGKLKYKYVIEEVNQERKVLKWILLFMAGFGVFGVGLVLVFMLYYLLGIMITSLLLALIGTVFLACFIFLFTQMFPKIPKRVEKRK